MLWLIWGLVHMLAGVIIVPADTAAGFQAIADAVDPAQLENVYHPAVGGVLDQHGYNLFWIGLVTVICSVMIWRENWTGVWLAALIGGLADVGYFVFVDLPGYAQFMPGTVMTIVSGSAIILSIILWRRRKNA
ncbi:MAG: hypothetical protein AAGB02_04690 [Pseudomonadota bacterium]